MANLERRQLSGSGGEVYSVGGRGQGDVDTRVDEEFCGDVGLADSLKDAAGKSRERCGGKIFFAELDEVDAAFGPVGGLTDEGCLLVLVVAGEDSAAGYGVAEHNLSVGVRE